MTTPASIRSSVPAFALEAPIPLPWLGDLQETAPAHARGDAHGASWLRVGPLFAADPHRPRIEQAAGLWLQAREMLAAEGFAFGDVVRTWLFVDDILEWYDGFNAARDAFFRDTHVTRLPASTAVGVKTGGRGAFALHLLAVKAPPGAPVDIRVADSPMQGPAADYGSRFSRGIRIETATLRALLVSGTASIDAAGATVHPGALAPQTTETRRVVERLLAAEGFSPADVVRAMHYGECEVGSGAPEWFGSRVDATVCRPDLCIEVELDAVRRVDP